MDGHKIQIANLKTRHHHKPYLLRHLSLLTAASWLVFTGLLGFVLSDLPTGQVAQVLSARTIAQHKPPAVFSSNGLSFLYDADRMRVNSQNDSVQVSMIKPNNASQASVRLMLRVGSNKNALSQSQKVLLSVTDDVLGGTKLKRSSYKQTVNIGDTTYAVYSQQWIGEKDGESIVLDLEGLQDLDSIPLSFKTVFDSLSFTAGGQVLGVNKELPANYTTDSVSPAVVKIYRVTCGTLLVDGKQVGAESCDASAGSGFFVSSEGHIATNGHVVTRDAEDILTDVLLNNPSSLVNFLKYLGLTDQQVDLMGNRPDLLAAVIARLYNAPKDAITLSDKRSTLLVSLGTRSLAIESEEDAKNLIGFKNTDSIKRAEVVDIDYSPKDLFVLASGDKEGFSASDVALIKVDARDTPYFKVFNGQVTQNQKITIIGFPGDADNLLTDNNSLSVTATNGSISAIRTASGSRHKLYQSDADASQGNSGGPVINEAGEVLGILTYRYKNDAASDAAKSYIRDIEDIKDLAQDNNISLNTGGFTQSNWTRGLQLFSENRFTKATAEFEKVNEAYPAHRLVSSYITAAEQGIAAGHDVQDMPFALAASMSFIGASGAAGAIVLMARHNSRHLSYKLATTNKTFTPHHAST